MDGQPLDQLNELECVDGAIYANVWMRDLIVRIDPASGRVTQRIEAANLLSPLERQSPDSAQRHRLRPVRQDVPDYRKALAEAVPRAIRETGRRSTLSPNNGRSVVPSAPPANADGSQSHPCRLPDAMPLK